MKSKAGIGELFDAVAVAVHKSRLDRAFMLRTSDWMVNGDRIGFQGQ
jgi:hypothetical protein